MESEGNVFEGIFWGSLLSFPLWLSLIGWVKLLLI